MFPRIRSPSNLAEVVLQKKASPSGSAWGHRFRHGNDIVQEIARTGRPVQHADKHTTGLPHRGDTGRKRVDNGCGKFVTHMGYEVIESKDNWNYSRSLLFAWAVPYFHTGVRLTYPFADNFTAALHIVNGWNSVIDNNEEKSIGLALSYSPTGSTGVILNVMDGFEQPTGIDVGKKKVFDFIINQQVSDACALSLNADYGDETLIWGLATWKGAAVYGRYVLGPVSAIALRGEVFDDPRGYATGLGVPRLDVKEVTATYEIKFADALLVRGEVRDDFSNAQIFDKRSNVGTETSQLTFLVGLVAMF